MPRRETTRHERLGWAILVLGLLALEGLLTFLVSPQAREPDSPSALQLLRVLSASGVTLLLPGLPLSRVLLCRRVGSPAKMLALAFVLNVVFHGLVVRIPPWPGALPDHQIVFCLVAVCSLAGLVAVCCWPPALRHSMTRTRTFSFELIFGALVLLIFCAVYYRDITRPSFRYFHPREVRGFLAYTELPGATHRFGSGFRSTGQGRYVLSERVATLALTRSLTAGAFPLRFVLLGPTNTRFEITGRGLRASKIQIRNMSGRKGQEALSGLEGYLAFPGYQSSLVALDVPAGVDEVQFEIKGPLASGSRILVEDHSNLTPAQRGGFFKRNKQGHLPMMEEAFYLIGNSRSSRDMILSHPDMPLGYLMIGVVETVCGRTLLGPNLLFVLCTLLCFLLACELIHHSRGRPDPLAFLFPALALVPILLNTVSINYMAFLPDALFVAALLSAMILLAQGHVAAFLLATVPAMLIRSTGVVVIAIHVLATALSSPHRKLMLKVTLLAGLCWPVLIWIMAYHQLSTDGGPGQIVASFGRYFAENKPADLGQYGAGVLGYLGKIFVFSGGLCLFILLPVNARGWQLLAVFGGYSLLLMSSSYQPFYRLMAPVMISAIGAGANILARTGRARTILLGLATGLAAVTLLGWLACNSHQPPTAARDSFAASRPSPSSLLQRTASTPLSASGPRSANLLRSHTPRYGVGEKCRLAGVRM